jgi:hypothetical protein
MRWEINSYQYKFRVMGRGRGAGVFLGEGRGFMGAVEVPDIFQPSRLLQRLVWLR